MKKFLTVAIAVMMIAVMSVFVSVSVFATDTTKITIDAEQLAIGVAEGHTLSDPAVQTKGEIKQVGVKATDKTPEAAANAYFEVPVTVDADCTAIVIKVTYHGNDDARYFAIRWNGAIVADDVGGDNEGNGGNYQTAFYEETVVENVVAGEYTVGVACPSGFGAGTISKTANISEIELTLTYAERTPETEAPETEAPETEAPETEAPETEAPETEAPETEAPETEAPETEAPETEAPETEAPETEAPETDAPVDDPEEDEEATQTGFITAALMVVAVGSGAYIVSKKR